MAKKYSALIDNMSLFKSEKMQNPAFVLAVHLTADITNGKENDVPYEDDVKVWLNMHTDGYLKYLNSILEQVEFNGDLSNPDWQKNKEVTVQLSQNAKGKDKYDIQFPERKAKGSAPFDISKYQADLNRIRAESGRPNNERQEQPAPPKPSSGLSRGDYLRVLTKVDITKLPATHPIRKTYGLQFNYNDPQVETWDEGKIIKHYTELLKAGLCEEAKRTIVADHKDPEDEGVPY